MTLTLSDFWKGRIHQLRQPSPILALYELALPDSTYLRYVDFMDAAANLAAPEKIAFDGKEFTARRITRTTIEDNSQTLRPQIALTVADPDHSAAFYVHQYRGLSGQTVTMWLLHYDRLDHPEDAITETFLVESTVIIQRPPSVSLVLGLRNLFEMKFPKLFYDRRRCYNSYQDRHVAGNWCRYPSNEFGASTEQDYKVGAANVEKERLHGWYTQQATRSSEFESNVSGRLKMESQNQYAAWEDEFRHGPYLYRYISGDFDVETFIQTLITDRAGWTIGFLAQDVTTAAPDPEEENPPPAPVSTWLLWATQDNGSGSRQLLKRVTTDSVSADTTIAATDLYLRLTRVGDAWTCYSKAQSADAWTQRSTQTLTLPTEARIGLAVASSDDGTDRVGGIFEYIRFNSGGLSSCARTWEDCLLHKNTIQFNGQRKIPNDRARM
jgi:hypothetical protein